MVVKPGTGAPARRLVRAVGAGIVGGVVLDGFLILAGLAPFPVVYQFIASGLVGAAAYSAPRFIAMGIALHFLISIFWALLYTLLAGQLGLLRRWVAGGVVWGVVVWAGMQGVEMYTRMAPAGLPAWRAAAGAAGIHVVCFGLPVAWWMRKG